MISRLLLCLVVALWPHVSSACAVQQRAVVPIEIVGNLMLVPVRVNGVAGTFILDTGAALTTVTTDAVSYFKLELDEWTATTMRGVGGIERRRNANPRSVEIGGVALHRRSVAQDATLRVATLSRGLAGGRTFDGLLGRDFLSLFDLSVDVPGHSLTLYEVRDCSGRFLPWPEEYLSVPVENPAESALVVTVELDGVVLRALLDTGATQTLVAVSGMARLGLGLNRLEGDPQRTMAGLGPHKITGWQHRFRSLGIGGETSDTPFILVAPISLYPLSDMLLGADWFKSRRVWISYTTKQLFVTKER